MKNHCFDRGIACCVAALVVLVMLLVVSSCSNGNNTQEDASRYAVIDSMMDRIHDVDSLMNLARQSREQNDVMGEMLALKHQGLLLSNQVHFAKSLEVISQWLNIATNAADTLGMADACNNLATVYRRIGEYGYACTNYYRVLKLCDAYSNQNEPHMAEMRSIALNGIAKIEMTLCRYSTADSLLRMAIDLDCRLGNNQELAKSYSDLGILKSEIGESDSAWYFSNKSLEFNKLCGSPTGVALNHLHFGEVYEQENNYSHAMEEYKQAYNDLRNMNDNWFWLQSCMGLARMALKLGEYDDAHGYIQEVEAEAKRIGSKVHQAEASMIHYELLRLQGNTAEALDQYVRSTELYDTIYGRVTLDEVQNQHIEYVKSRDMDEANMLNRDINRLKRMRNIQGILTTLLVLMAAAIIAALAYVMRMRNRTQRRMRQVEETRSLFFTNVVHQLRTPLSAIMGATDNLISDAQSIQYEPTNAQREYVEIIERQGNNLLTLVDRILEVGGVRSAIKDPDWHRGDVIAYIRMIVEGFRDRCIERNIELSYAPYETGVEADTVPRYLTTIVGNLIENAILYSRDGGRITVTSRVEDDMLVIKVADEGMGISTEDLPHVFEPFYRSAEAERRADGVGIGLTVVRDMTMVMGGTVSADSKSDVGSVFTVKLPCSRTHDVKKRLTEAVKPILKTVPIPHLSSEPSNVDEVCAGGPVALVVEDHNDVASLVGTMLGDGYTVLYATDGEQGFAKALDTVPDIIITDVKMPIMDGIELCRRVRRDKSLCHVPVIIISARNSDADRILGIEAGADAYLVKPFSSDELRAWAKRLIESREALREVFAADAMPKESDTEFLPDDIDVQDDDKEFLEKFVREVEEQFASGTKLDLDKVARSFKMGETQLRNKVQTILGKNPVSFITQLRMKKAMRLLQQEEPKLLIGDVAEQCGYQDVAYFSRVFRQYYGITPTQARPSVK
ncbi:MAG: response regulator [Muribaculaceae bacterium]|nr:response regulator [Muribaculaceae bacterium]